MGRTGKRWCKPWVALFLYPVLCFAGLQTWEDRMAQANRLRSQGAFSEAETLYQAALTELQGLGELDARTGGVLNNLASLYHEQG